MLSYGSPAIEPIHQYTNKSLEFILYLKTQEYVAAESFIRALIKIYGKHIVYSDGGTRYPKACISLGLEHRLHSPSSYEEKNS
jgi:transposase-like protein